MANETVAERARQFLAEATQFRLGKLLTESPHPRSAQLSQRASENIAAGLEVLFDVDRDVLETYRQWAQSDAPERIRDEALAALRAGGRLYFTGCGATGRLSIQLDSIWRDFWQRRRAAGLTGADEWEDRTFSIMAGGDFALIKSVEGFEDYTQFGRRQIRDRGVRAGDVVFAITEGGETSFVIGTAWEGLDAGARVFFVYNNPDDVLRENVERSREVIDEPSITKINLTTGPMAITGSTRMQATSIQLCVMMTILEMVLGALTGGHSQAADVPGATLRALEEMHATLASEALRDDLARLVAREESVYRARHRNTYFSDRLGIDVLTDTTERSPTFCVPSFRKFDDPDAAESWSFLFLPPYETAAAWEHLLKRPLAPVEWSLEQVCEMLPPGEAERQHAIMRGISREEILRFRIGLDGLPYRTIGPGDAATAILTEEEKEALFTPGGFYRKRLEQAHAGGAATAVLFFGRPGAIEEVRAFLSAWEVPALPVLVPVPETELLLNLPLRVGAKMLLNALSTCTMVRLGRSRQRDDLGVPSNLKLIDRSTATSPTYRALLRGGVLPPLRGDGSRARWHAGKEYPAPWSLGDARPARPHFPGSGEAPLRGAGNRAPARLIRRQETLGPTPTPGGAAGRPQGGSDGWGMDHPWLRELSAGHVREWRAESLRLARRRAAAHPPDGSERRWLGRPPGLQQPEPLGAPACVRLSGSLRR